MPTKEKEKAIADFAASIQGSTSLIVTHNKGLNAAEVTELRNALRAAGLTHKVVKNTLAARAAKQAGFDSLESLLTGPTAITYTKGDMVAPAKALVKFAKDHEKLVVIGGIIEGKAVNQAEVQSFAALPSKEELIGMLLRTINGPASSLARVLNAWVEKRQAAEGSAPAA